MFQLENESSNAVHIVSMDLSIPAPATYAPASLLCNSNISNYIVNQRLLYSLSKGRRTAYPNFSIFEAQITPQLFAKRHRKKCIVSIIRS